jgi:hypothetical protein
MRTATIAHDLNILRGITLGSCNFPLEETELPARWQNDIPWRRMLDCPYLSRSFPHPEWWVEVRSTICSILRYVIGSP